MTEIAVLPVCEASPDLFASSGLAEGSFTWFRTLAATTLAPQERAVAAVLFRNGLPAAALPIVQSRDGMRALTAPYTTIYAPALPQNEAAEELGRLARRYAKGVMRLDGIEPSQPGIAAFLCGLQASGMMVAQYQGFANWYEPLSNFESYWQARPSRLRATVRRKLAAADRAGLQFRMYRDDWDHALSIYDEIYSSSWKSPEPHSEFIPTMVRELGREGLVRIGVMSINDRPVAAQIWLVSTGRGTIFKLAHREDAAALSPGTLLTYRMAELLIGSEHLHEIDFGRGDDAYKRDWLSRRRARIGVIAADWRSAAGLSAIVREVIPTRGARALQRHWRTNHKSYQGAADSTDVVGRWFRALYRSCHPVGNHSA